MDIPKVGFGTFELPNDATTTEIVRYAIEEAGYRHIDTAQAYFNEEAVGAAIRDCIARGVVKREELFVVTKLWCTDYAPEDVEPALRASLKRLGLDYVDLYLMHQMFRLERADTIFPMKDGKLCIAPNSACETYKAMQPLVEKGLAKHIGVSNWNIEMLEKLRCTPGVTIQPYANQIEVHLYQQVEAMIHYCEWRGIYITAWGPLGRGKAYPVVVLDDPVLNEVAKEVGQSPANVELKFIEELSPRMTILVKSKDKGRVKSNNHLDFKLTAEQIEKLKKRNRAQPLFNRLKDWGIDINGDLW